MMVQTRYDQYSCVCLFPLFSFFFMYSLGFTDKSLTWAGIQYFFRLTRLLLVTLAPVPALGFFCYCFPWRRGHHPCLPPLRPRFNPGLVRGLRLVDLNLTPRVFLRGFSLRKNQLSRLKLCLDDGPLAREIE